MYLLTSAAKWWWRRNGGPLSDRAPYRTVTVIGWLASMKLLEQNWDIFLHTQLCHSPKPFNKRLAVDIEETVKQTFWRYAVSLCHPLLPLRVELNRRGASKSLLNESKLL